jgi:tRNA(fMet)-specific endonuclease VapC
VSGRPRFALDTNALIHALKGVGRVRESLLAQEPAAIAVPAVVVYEIEAGTLRSANPAARRMQLRRFLSALEVLAFDARAAEKSARIRADLEKLGHMIGPHDILIAGTALANGCTLITHNTREFSRVAGLETEDWF